MRSTLEVLVVQGTIVTRGCPIYYVCKYLWELQTQLHTHGIIGADGFQGFPLDNHDGPVDDVSHPHDQLFFENAQCSSFGKGRQEARCHPDSHFQARHLGR